MRLSDVRGEGVVGEGRYVVVVMVVRPLIVEEVDDGFVENAVVCKITV